jgi:hypothetical protein
MGTLIILFSEMLKFSQIIQNIFFQRKIKNMMEYLDGGKTSTFNSSLVISSFLLVDISIFIQCCLPF